MYTRTAKAQENCIPNLYGCGCMITVLTPTHTSRISLFTNKKKPLNRIQEICILVFNINMASLASTLDYSPYKELIDC